MPRSLSESLPALLWGSSQAGSSLIFASSAWFISGLTNSPLLNSFLPALGAIPLLLHIKRRPNGYLLQIVSVSILIVISLSHREGSLPNSFLLMSIYAALLLHGIGQEMSILPLQRRLLAKPGTSMQELRIGQDLGAFAGNLMTAILFPAIRQFPPAFILLLPLAGKLRSNSPEEDVLSPTNQRAPLSIICGLQGLVLGALFALLALWVRECGGNCFDFGMILAAYGIGRPLILWLPSMPSSLRYALVVALLLVTQFIGVPWIAVALFVPMGALISATDTALVNRLTELEDAPMRWYVLQRSGALGGLLGSIGLGILCQFFGLAVALPIVCIGFVALMFVNCSKFQKDSCRVS